MRLRYQFIFAFLAMFALLGVAAGDAALSAELPTIAERPSPSIDTDVSFSPAQILDTNVPSVKLQNPPIQGAPPLLLNWSALSFDDNAANVNTYFIPPDPIGAAGPNHVVNVCNVSIQWYDKVGTLQNNQGLNAFFAPLGPPLGTFTFDPKVIYDQYAERFVVVSLERTTSPGNGSYILVAVSRTSDPNAGWFFHAINSRMTIGGVDSWADYPGLAVDDKAIYITNNMFPFSTSTGSYGVRLWIIDKNPLYSGGAAIWSIYDPYAQAGVSGNESTTQPAHTFGAPPAGLRTFLCTYSGWTNGGVGGTEWLHIIEVADPLGTGGGPFFTQGWCPVGDIEDIGSPWGWPALADAPQFGTAATIEVNDRRALNAVWRDNNLYISTTITPNAGVDASQTTAHWFRVNTTGGIGALALADQGNVGAEDLGTATYTFFPSVMVDHCGGMAIGFAACNQSMYCGAYYTGRKAGDPAGTVQPTGVLAAGQDYYLRTFGGSRNRWGDYSGLALDPMDEVTFWVYNEYAMTRGTLLGGSPEDGRWATRWGSFILGCPPVAVAITGFEARSFAGGVELTGSFATDSDQLRVNVYRSGGTHAEAIRYKSIELVDNNQFRYVDTNVLPGESYRYYIGVVDKDGEFLSPTMEVVIPLNEAALLQNEPNPFNPVTTISFMMPSAQHARLAIYDASGKLVRTLVDGVTGYGTHRVEWDGTDNLGHSVG
ncbi:MAG: hypothetical protein KAI97_02130, partial [Gemmatimonadetes bacterium]|nr:hypothetical protein [Gemmatimonadota bacterium]